jgi:tetratricopeptide (TPR) repeat protein
VGLLNPAPGAVVWFQPKSSDGRSRARLDALVARTCADRTTATYWNAVGVQLLSLNPPAVSYAAAKALASGHSLNCDYDAIGYYDNDEERSWNLLMSRKITYYIAVDPSVHKIPSTLVDTTVNQLNEPIRRRIEKSGLFELEPGLDGYEGILIFRRVDQIDHVANGRALSDQGLQQQAIDELNKATQLEPANVEAWANLALVHERNGSLEEALSAGGRARALAADHYYVNLGLARVLLQRKEWSTAVRRAEDAAAHSPGLAEKVNAIVIAAEASFQARDAAAGCKFLMTAASLRSDRSILEGLERNRCGK